MKTPNTAVETYCDKCQRMVFNPHLCSAGSHALPGGYWGTGNIVFFTISKEQYEELLSRIRVLENIAGIGNKDE